VIFEGLDTSLAFIKNFIIAMLYNYPLIDITDIDGFSYFYDTLKSQIRKHKLSVERWALLNSRLAFWELI